MTFKDYKQAKTSTRSYNYIKAYGANTYKGLIRDYNEDRVSIILNIKKPEEYKSKEPWPACSLFAVYDGHGGSACADFLRDNLHNYVINDVNFPKNPKKAIIQGFQKAEKEIL